MSLLTPMRTSSSNSSARKRMRTDKGNAWKAAKFLWMKKIIIYSWGNFTKNRYICQRLLGEIRGLQKGIWAEFFILKSPNLRIHQGTRVKDAPFAVSYMLTDGRRVFRPLAIYRFGVGWLFSSVLLVTVFGGSRNSVGIYFSKSLIIPTFALWKRINWKC